MDFQTIPKVDMSEVDILYVSSRDTIARDGVLVWKGVCYFRAEKIFQVYPAGYMIYPLSAEEVKQEERLHGWYEKLVDENSNYLGNMRVQGGETRPAVAHAEYYKLIKEMTPRRQYHKREPLAWFTGRL